LINEAVSFIFRPLLGPTRLSSLKWDLTSPQKVKVIKSKSKAMSK